MGLPVVQNLFLHKSTIETWVLRSFRVIDKSSTISSLEDIKLDFLATFLLFWPKNGTSGGLKGIYCIKH